MGPNISHHQGARVGKYGAMGRRLLMTCRPIVSSGQMQHVPKDLPCPHPSRPPGTGKAKIMLT